VWKATDWANLKNIAKRWRLGPLRRSIDVLSRSDQKKLIVSIVLQILTSTLDLLGVFAIGLLGALSISSIQSQAPDDQLASTLRFLHLSQSSLQTQMAVLGIGAVVLLVVRTMLSILFTRKILFFLSRRGAKISANLVSRLLSQSLLVVQARSTQETLYSLTTGVSLITLQVLASAVVLVSDLSLLLVMGLGLFVINPATAMGTLLVFSIIGYLLHHFMSVRAGELGRKSAELNIVSNEKIVEVFSSYRESVVRNRRDYYAREIGVLRFALANTTAEMSFLPYVSKYVIETAVIVGALLIGATQLILQDASNAVATLAVFLAAGTRIAPAVLRVQQGIVTIRGALGQATPTLDLIDLLGSSPMTEIVDDTVDVIHDGFVPEIKVNSVSLTYPARPSKAITDVTLNIRAGAFVAFVGPSGAGKTTIIDVLLGVLNPDQGDVLISGLSPLSAVAKWPGAISYVPQDTVISVGTIRENIALGYPPDAATEELVTSALKIAHLDEFVAGLPLGIDTQVGERGAKISGGQRQRLGIARAMFTKPLLLVLDEATSSLDGETEATISEAIHTLRGSTTIVVIAHRLSTVRNADLVVYLSGGKVLATGNFEEVRAAVVDFDQQAKLMGL
jgi:ABC-type multidrug transport system fused ATPase/permease subunit